MITEDFMAKMVEYALNDGKLLADNKTNKK